MSKGLDINNNSSPKVVGISITSIGESHGFVWQSGTMTDLGTYGGSGVSAANAINDAGQIVGNSGGAAVLWEGGQVYNLNDLTNSGNYGLTSAVDINENGQILAQGSGGFYLLTPSGQ